MACEKGHALIRIYDNGRWYLACVHCPYRTQE